MTTVPDISPKSFWSKPEGKTGILALAAMIGGGAFLLFKVLPIILPILVSILANTLHATLLLIALGSILYLLMNKRFRTLVSYMFKSIMRFITKIFIEIDPIGVLESYVDDLKENLSKMDKQIGNLRGQMRKLKTNIDNNRKEMEQSLKMASKAKDAGKQNVMVLKTRKAGRLKDSTITLQNLYTKMEILYRVLSKMFENASFLLEDIADEVDVRKKEREAIRAGHSAFTSAMKVISGDPDKRAMFDMAMEAVADDVGEKIGEMERFMDISANFIDSIDLQNGIFEEEGLKLLEKWEEESTSLLLGGDKQSLMAKANDDSSILDLDASVSPGKKGKGSQYSKLFDLG